ncbi:class I SAM-dependent methyltransferase [Pontibacter toksunensis]|uniref:Class I SAM-dependent methyltransferase n=1 Tax=Pontibacter toksunensis TaxID=1332631 RepID=A0ABW6BMP4_9BACT
MNTLLEEIFTSQQFKNSKGEIVKIHSETNKEQCKYLQRIIKDNEFSKSIEIGFAYGVSTLAITEAIANNNGKHVVIDKFQNSGGWNGNGLELINTAGFKEHVDFHEQYCYEALPKLMLEGKKFDFAYIDSTKQFDWIFINFFYLDKMLDLNGIIVFDDVIFPGIRKVLRFIARLPNYKVYSQHPKNYLPSLARRSASFLSALPNSEKFFRDDLLTSDYQMGVNSGCVAVKKVDEDNRNWDWHVDF